MDLISFFFEEKENPEDEFRQQPEVKNAILKDYLESFDYNDDNSQWFDKLKSIAQKNGFATDRKDYKENPDKYKGETSDVAEVIRIAVTGRANTPDLWGIIHIMGEEQMRERIMRRID